MYDNVISNLSKTIEAELLLIETIYNFEYGDEFEIALCNILRKFLPHKYGICRGFAVHQSGESVGDDIIIYDRSSFPTFFYRGLDNFSRLEKIPIEAIYAYIECKHNLLLSGPATESASLLNASRQVANFKELCNKREAVLVTQKDSYIKLVSEIANAGNLPANWWLPKLRNPIFGCIFSRKVSNKKTSAVIEDTEEVHKILINGMDIEKGPNVVDLVVAGQNNFMSPAYREEGDDKPQNCLFMLPDKQQVGLSCFKHENQALSIGIIHLMAALDWIRLGRIKWEAVLNYYNHGQRPTTLRMNNE